MKLKIQNIRLKLDHSPDDMKKAVAKKIGVKPKDIKSIKKLRQAVDARKSHVFFNLTVEVDLKIDIIEEIYQKLPDVCLVKPDDSKKLYPGNREMLYNPVIVGAGPAGLMVTLLLARHGYGPILIEQGEDLYSRVKTVKKFWQHGEINSYSNVQFGEGGAGTFSDGKLTSRIGDGRVELFLQALIDKGAPPAVLYEKKPHLGTDVIQKIVLNIRQEILDRGGEIYFNARLTDFDVQNEQIKSIIINDHTELHCSLLVLAIGNSARELFRLLSGKNILFRPKAFAVGLRVEHPQILVDQVQYGSSAGHPRLGAADYHLVYRDQDSGRSMYSFCMCPGGQVIAAASAPQQVVTNGMSYAARNSGVANSALVVTVNPGDWNHEPLGGLILQEQLERQAFSLGGGNYYAPGQLIPDFLDNRESPSLEHSLATYQPGLKSANLKKLFPGEIAGVLHRGLIEFSGKYSFFRDARNVLTGVETRTSSPVRIERTEELCVPGLEGLYPCGEGAGYAGGIVSSAVDGMKVAEKIIANYALPRYQQKLSPADMVRARELSINK